MQTLFFPVSNFIAGIQKMLRDEYGVSFDVLTELLPLLNLASSEIVNADPQALVKNVPFQIQPFRVSVATGGTGYAEGDTWTPAGGTPSAPMTLVIAGVQNGAADLVVVQSPGVYGAYPASPMTQGGTSGSGTGLTVTLTLVGGRQELPPYAASLVNIRRNLGADGQTIGPIITQADRDEMDAIKPSWPMDVCGVAGQPAQPIHYIPDNLDPKRFYLWPYPNVMVTPCYVETVYRAVPDNVGLNDNFPLPALYEPAARYYVCAHAMLRLDSMDERFAKCQQLIPVFLGLFNQSLGLTNAAIATTTPPHRVNKA